jgi:transcriptional regulator with XRE-family HTH domain
MCHCLFLALLLIFYRVKNMDGERLKNQRELQNWSQQELADRAGVSLHTVFRAEKGTNIQSKNLEALASALNISVAYLMGETNDPEHREHQGLLDIHHLPQDSQITTKGHPLSTLNKYRPASLEDFARVRESSRNVESLDERDLNAAAEMLRASLEAIEREQLNRAIQQDGVAG